MAVLPPRSACPRSRRHPRPPSAAWSSRTGPSSSPLLPHARLPPRRGGRPPGEPAAGLARPGQARRAARSCAPGSTGSPPTSASTQIKRRPKRVLPVDYGPPPIRGRPGPSTPVVESIWVGPYPDAEIGLEDGYAAPEATYEQREAVELAFVAALQHLPANQRAVLILRDVLGFSARETAEALDTSSVSVNSALQRAHRTVEERLPERSQQANRRELGDDGPGDWRRHTPTPGPATTSARSAHYSPKTSPSRCLRSPSGGAAARPCWRSASGSRRPARTRGRSRSRPTARPGSPGTAGTRSGDSGRLRRSSRRLRGELVKNVTAFVEPEIFERFGVPPTLDVPAPSR